VIADRKTLGTPIRIYVWGLASITLTIGLVSLVSLVTGHVAMRDVYLFVGITALIAIATARPVEIRRHVKLSLRTAPQLMAAILLSPAEALLAAGIGLVLGYAYHLTRGRHNMTDLLFGSSQSVMSTVAAALAYSYTMALLAGPFAEPAALLLAAEAMHLTNSALVAGAMALSGQESSWPRAFVRLIGNEPLQYAALLVSGILGALLAREAFWAVPLLLVPLALVERMLIKQREEAERERKLQVMEEVNRLKNDFIAGVTHDLRTPLMVIKGFGELLAEREDEFMDDERRAVTSINSNAERLSELIEMLLQLSELDAGMVVLNRQPSEVPAIVHRVVEQLRFHAEQKGVTVEMNAGVAIPPIAIDRARIEQVIANLLGNAIKFTSTGGHVTVDMRIDNDNLFVRVSDTGSGIPADVLPHIFDRFYRANHPESGRRQTGGLGLAVAKSIVELHGGQIMAESESGVGTTITVLLPRSGPGDDRSEGAVARDDQAIADVLRPARPLPHAR
jgi:signal transduction histidine kinase